MTLTRLQKDLKLAKQLIEKYAAIPEEKWCKGSTTTTAKAPGVGVQHCAIGFLDPKADLNNLTGIVKRADELCVRYLGKRLYRVNDGIGTFLDCNKPAKENVLDGLNEIVNKITKPESKLR